MEVAATMTSKGQVTVPKPVRDALGVDAGDRLLFRVEGDKAIVTRTVNFLDLAGSVHVPADKRNASWRRVRDETRAARASKRR